VAVKVLICGDRNWDDKAFIRKRMRALEPDTIVVHGAAKGADSLAGEVAEEMGFEVHPYPAAWGVFGRAAGPIRNTQMLDEEEPDMVWGFHDWIENSKGTRDMMRQAQRRGVPFMLFSHPPKRSKRAKSN
jgi:hypothetical protein